MYAVMSRWPMNADQQEIQDKVLHDRIVPMVKQAPGLVSGYWSRTADGAESVTFHVFDDEATATAFAAMVMTNPEDREKHGVGSPSWHAIMEIGASV